MKFYQVVLEVPDDFNPDDTEIIASSSGQVKVHAEGFVEAAEEEGGSEWRIIE